MVEGENLLPQCPCAHGWISPKHGMWPHIQMSKICISFFSDAVIKHHDHGNLQKKEFLWDQGSREIRLHHGTEPWQQRVGIIVGTES